MKASAQVLVLAVALLAAASARASGGPAGSDTTLWVDHDGRPIRQPPPGEQKFWAHQVRQGVEEPIGHIFDIPDKFLWLARRFGARTEREAVNVNAFDETPNSSWFTNRNHVHSVPRSELVLGPDSTTLPAAPFTVTHPKKGGMSTGFQVKDAKGRKWLIKLDPKGHPQLASGADMVARTLVHAAGYNVPHNEPLRFRRSDLNIDEALLKGTKGEFLSEAGLDTILSRGATFPDGRYSADASLFLPGHVLGAPNMQHRRKGDSNDWYSHANRRELRGLYVIASWVNFWDTKDHNFLDMFSEDRDSAGHVVHYVLDLSSSLGSGSDAPRKAWQGNEMTIDYGWIGKRFITLGFAHEPWLKLRDKPVPASTGDFESSDFRPGRFRPLMEQSAFHRMTDRDAYWGAKLVASFSEAQIRAAVASAGYDDTAAVAYLERSLIDRRNKIACYWFARVVPLDFFVVRDGVLSFRDLMVDIGLEAARRYEVEVHVEGGGTVHRKLDTPELQLESLGGPGSRMDVELSVDGLGASPAHVRLERRNDGWVVVRVRHG